MKNQMRRKRTIFLAAVAMVAGLTAACGPHEERAAEAGPVVSGVETQTVQEEPTPQFYEAVGTVRSANTAVLAAQVGGAVREIRVQPGDHVRRGQMLAVLDDRSAQAQAQGA